MPKKTGWNIRPPDMGRFLESIRQGTFAEDSLAATTTYTVLRNAKRNDTEIAELVAATGASSWDANSMVTLSFERLVLFDTVAALETEVRMKEDDLRALVQDVYRHHMKPASAGEKSLKQMEADIQKTAKWASMKIMDDVNLASQNLSEKHRILLAGGPSAAAIATFDKIKTRLLLGQYKPAESICDHNGQEVADEDTVITPNNVNRIAQALTEKIVFDRCYTQHAQEAAAKYVDKKLKRVLEANLVNYPGTDEPLQRLSVQKGEDRHTFMLAGAPACGKGTIVAAMEVLTRDSLGINWEDTVKINTDNHREIVSNARGMGDDLTVHSDLNDFEAAYITNRAYARAQTQLDRNEGHHLVIDGVYPSKGRFAMGTQNGGQLHVSCVSVPVDVSVERAFKRGTETGRYVGSGYLVGAHKSVSSDLLKNMIEKCQNTDSELSIFNTDVPRGEQPIQAMQLDMRAKKAIIYDADSMATIYGKKNINSNATNREQLYASEQDKLDYSYVTELDSLGITVEFASIEMQEKVTAHLSVEEEERSLSL